MGVLLKTKAQLQFDKAVTGRSKVVFSLVSPSNLVQFLPPSPTLFFTLWLIACLNVSAACFV
jgi:hypothetical protein